MYVFYYFCFILFVLFNLLLVIVYSCWVQEQLVLQNILFLHSTKKESHVGLEQHV